MNNRRPVLGLCSSFLSAGRRARSVAVVLATMLIAGASACTEEYAGGSGCPLLCPSKPVAFRDTTLDAAVELDTTLGNYPELGLSLTHLLANRPDTLVNRMVMRFDVLPTTFLPNAGTVSEPITAVDSVFLVIPLDTTGRLGNTPVSIELFDVDTTQNDSSQAVVKSLFRDDRRIGGTIVVPSAQTDTIRIPILKEVLASKISKGARLRVGLRMSAGGQLRVIAFALGAGAPYLRFDPSTDTLYKPQTISLTTSMDGAPNDVLLSYIVYGLLDKGSDAPDRTTLLIGGYPAYRTYLRVSLPKIITDSSTIVRAEVLLTQKPSKYANVNDSVTILPLVPTSTSAISDIRRIIDLSADGVFASLDSTRLVPKDSGLRVINVLSLARTWTPLAPNVPRGIAFRIGTEGANPAELRFYSIEAAPSLRPRLRITYLPRTEGSVP